MTTKTKIGIGWRPEIALMIEENGIEFTEVVAENCYNQTFMPPGLVSLLDRKATVIPHGIGLSLGSADKPDLWRLEKLAKLAEKMNAPYVSEHIALVRGGGYESGHLLPVERTQEMLEIVAENVTIAQSNLPVPLVLENIATLVDWKTSSFSEAEFVSRLLKLTGAKLLLDVSNLYANCHNHGIDYKEYLSQLPLDQIEYVHVAGGVHKDKLYHDTHAHPVANGPLEILAELCRRVIPPAVLLERDDHFATTQNLLDELTQIRQVVELNTKVVA